MKPHNEGKSIERRLVLGFDGGCFTCSALAGRIEQRLEGKLEIRSLRDPQVQEWSREALGENAPWAPTLFEINETKVRAWTGWKMGVNLGRFLGPAATWRIMQELGAVTAVPAIEASPTVEAIGISRTQFLRHIGGAAVAASVISGGLLLPSTAKAQESSGTMVQQKLAKNIIRNSIAYERLASLQEDINATFDWNNTIFKMFGNGIAIVNVSSLNKRRCIVTQFFVNLKQRSLEYHFYWTLILQNEAIRASFFNNGRAARNRYVIVGDNYVVTADDRVMSIEQFREMIRKASADSVLGARSFAQTPYLDPECVAGQESFCNNVTEGLCRAVGGAAVLLTRKPSDLYGNCKDFIAYSDGCSSYGVASQKCYRTGPPPEEDC